MATLVLADDSPAVRQVVQLSFAGEDFRVHCCEDGESTLDFLANHSVDILLIDVALPGLDGYEMCQRVKQNPYTAHVSVVLLGSVFEPLDITRGEAAQCDASLTKPLVASQLVELAKRLLVREPRDQSLQDQGKPLAASHAILKPGKNLVQLTASHCRAAPFDYGRQWFEHREVEPKRSLAPNADRSSSGEASYLDRQHVTAMMESILDRLLPEMREDLPRILEEILKRRKSRSQ